MLLECKYYYVLTSHRVYWDFRLPSSLLTLFTSLSRNLNCLVQVSAYITSSYAQPYMSSLMMWKVRFYWDFCHGRQKETYYYILGCIYPSQWQNHLGDGSIFIYFQSSIFGSCPLAVVWSIKFSMGIFPFGVKDTSLTVATLPDNKNSW